MIFLRLLILISIILLVSGRTPLLGFCTLLLPRLHSAVLDVKFIVAVIHMLVGLAAFPSGGRGGGKAGFRVGG